MRALILAFLLVILIAAAGAAPAPAAERNPVVPATLGEARLELELVQTPAARYQGLSGRPALASGRGMAFAYPYPDRWRMVMRDMLIGLDFVWVRAGVVVGVTPSVPPPKPGQTPLEVGPPEDIDMVLELPAGWAVSHGVGKNVRLVLSPRP